MASKGARESGVLEGRAEVTVYGPIALRIGVVYTGTPEKLRPSGGARVQALSQTDQGIDMVAGPLISYVLGPVALAAQAGVSVVGTEADTLAGPIVLASISGTL